MSSEGSVSTTSSGVRQFGLYRTIDARTEEFLRLSRKRQIRQGCACAAISTAITVIVVISIALIYEYTIFYESNSKASLKPNWLSLMNKSADIPFEAKLNKAKINLDPIYVQFLPLILKTMKKNKYFDKLLEEDSSQTPVYERIENQEEKYTKNIFSDTRNWMRVPTSRLYAIEYKTSPIVYFKNPTRNIDHFTKIRRIRDYQRIMNYVDKMISERVTYGSTIPMFKNTYSFHRKFPIITHTTPMTKDINHVIKKTEPKNPNYSNQVLSTDTKMNCRCPKQMSELLSKLIKSLHKLIPDFVSNEEKTTIPCDESRLKTIEPIKNTLGQAISKIPLETSTRDYRSNHKLNKISIDFHTKNLFTSTQNIQTPDSKAESLEIFKIQSIYQPSTNQPTLKTNTVSKMLYLLKPLKSKTNDSPSSIIKFLKPSLYQNIVHDKMTNEFTTTIDQFIEATDPNYDLQESTTKPMTALTSTTKVAPILTTVKDYILNENNRNIKSLLNLPTYNGNLYEDYNVDTTPDIVNSFKVLDAHSIELVKNKFWATGNERKNMKEVSHFKNNDDLTNHKVDYTSDRQYATNTMNILKKMGTLALTTTDSSYDANWKLNNSSTETSLEEKIDNLNMEANSSQKLRHNKQEQQLKIEDITLEEEIDKAFTEDMASEYNTKNVENTMNKLNATDINKKTLSKDSTDLYLELTENEDLKDKDSKMSRSMIPESRSSYLEIQRNDWKHDENQDYDNNINNYFFD